ncbi:MAG: restriction endonuclease subunit M [Lentisphaerae bacterium]|nr:restriction endonuclease subunit M [Lentisphaerota bacterium]
MKIDIKSIGSVCSGIEAASVAWNHLNMDFRWFSEIATFPNQLLQEKYPYIPNCGDMNLLPQKILSRTIDAPDLICAGTPCQAFSLAGWKHGLNDARGNLALKLIDIVDANDKIRIEDQKKGTILFWENVEGVLTDKTNAFGYFVSILAGFETFLNFKWGSAGIIKGPKRNIAWRVLDAKFFGVPQQRRRLYLLAGGTDFNPENILFETGLDEIPCYPKHSLVFEKEGHKFQVFREYTDCLYSSYGTKWNGNAAAYNGSLFVVQDGYIRRLSVLEAERLMGFPDNYTLLNKSKKTCQYQALGNSWAIPVVKWLGERISNYVYGASMFIDSHNDFLFELQKYTINDQGIYVDLSGDFITINHQRINVSPVPTNYKFTSIHDVIEVNTDESLYISPVGCHGIIRRKQERNLRINPELEKVLLMRSSEMSYEEIEKKSLVQKRGRYATKNSQTVQNIPDLFSK